MACDGRAISLHPFPLFPAQLFPGEPPADRPRRHLFSFVGARPSKWYLTATRRWILEHLADDPRGKIVGRDDWHYNRFVYDFQIMATVPTGAGLIDEAAGAEFRETLRDSVFSLCPSGTGPNSIRLWESIGAGAIPVLLSDGFQPAGSPQLWAEAAVPCPETEDAIRALPERLAAMAADPDDIARRRRAMEQLWLLYGPEGFVHDIRKLAVSQASAAASAGPIPAEAGDGMLGRLAGAARRAIAPLRAVAGSPPRAAAPPRVKVALFGRHANRTPLAYPAYRPYFEGRLEIVERPEDADVAVFGFSADIRPNAALIRALKARNPGLKLAVVSEEPLWDTVWSGPFAERRTRMQLGDQPVGYAVLNHFTTAIYAFDRIPYFITTDDDFAVRYGALLARNRSVSARELLAHWSRAEVRTAFYAARRVQKAHALEYPEADIRRLSGFRTRLAMLVGGDGVHRVGEGWSDALPRQSLPDWHLDKLAALDRRTFLLSAVENTHQVDYVTEKIFDAYAVLAVPIYHAGPRHRVREIVGSETFLDVGDQSATDAAGTIERFAPDLDFAERYRETLHRLSGLFSDPASLVAERARVAGEIVREIEDLARSDTESAMRRVMRQAVGQRLAPAGSRPALRWSR